jgi:hypothetical protein
MNSRPKPGQSDEELIRQNEEFLKLNKRKSENEEEDPKLEGKHKHWNTIFNFFII